MSEGKKPGFFGRLFRFDKPAAAPAPESPKPEEPAAVSEAAMEAPAPVALAEAPPAVIESAHTTASVMEAVQEAPAEPVESATEIIEPPVKKSWFQRLREGLSKTSSKLTASLTTLFTHRKLDDDTLEELEDILIQSDFGVETSARITAAIRAGRYNKEISPEEVRELLAGEIEKILSPLAAPLSFGGEHRPHVILVVGVNGTGKTTTIGKLANDLTRAGKRVMLAAGDTFRAAAIEQLKIWGERSGAAVVSGADGADAAGLAFDALRQAQAENRDVLIIDTAGRLQNKAYLMAELEKIIRVLKKLDESAPHTVLLTLDATTGQNALNQVEMFGRTAGVTGLVMTKLDGTARGGILVAIAAKHGLPVHAIGVGEGIDDLQTFSAREFARAITAG
jgi:fused signal recognition particle receptor